jgi:hypothetical protein
MGGMLSATFLAIFFIPLFFRIMTDGKLVEKRSTAELRDEVARHKAEAAAAQPTTSGPPPIPRAGESHA